VEAEEPAQTLAQEVVEEEVAEVLAREEVGYTHKTALAWAYT
jgi:hypothetical protein